MQLGEVTRYEGLTKLYDKDHETISREHNAAVDTYYRFENFGLHRPISTSNDTVTECLSIAFCAAGELIPA